MNSCNSADALADMQDHACHPTIPRPAKYLAVYLAIK